MPGYLDPRFINNNVFTPIKKVTSTLATDKISTALQTVGSSAPSRSALLKSQAQTQAKNKPVLGSLTALSAPPAKKLDIPNRLVYPSELGTTQYVNRPVIELCCLDSRPQFGILENTSVYLPAPALSISNNSMYDDTALGVMGAAALEGIGSIKQNDTATGVIDSLISKAKQGGENAKNSLDVKTGVLFGISKAIEALPGSGLDSVAKAAKIASRATLNTNVVTEFTATATREYELQFKFIPNSQAEAQVINDMVKLFKISVYPAVSNLILLEYPPRWKIRFMTGFVNDNGQFSSGTENNAISKLFDCYLMSCNISYNNETNAYFEDGNPLETTISLTFKETRALNANDISNL